MATSFATPPLPALNLHCKYSLFDLLSLKPLASKVSLQRSKLVFTPSLDSLMKVHHWELPMVLGSHLAWQGFGILQPKGRTDNVPWPCAVARSCAIGSSRPESSPYFCPVLRPDFTNHFAFILVIILADHLALQAIFLAKKKRLIWS